MPVRVYNRHPERSEGSHCHSREQTVSKVGKTTNFVILSEAKNLLCKASSIKLEIIVSKNDSYFKKVLAIIRSLNYLLYVALINKHESGILDGVSLMNRLMSLSRIESKH